MEKHKSIKSRRKTNVYCVNPPLSFNCKLFNCSYVKEAERVRIQQREKKLFWKNMDYWLKQHMGKLLTIQ